MKHVTILGLLWKPEASYNAGGVLSPATDGFLLAELPEFTEEWGDDGARAAPPGTLGHMTRGTPTGRTLTVPFQHEPRGGGAPYSASVKPSIHDGLRAAGFDATLTSTAGSEKYEYTPTPHPDNFLSLVAELYARGEKYPFQGIYLDWEIVFDGAKIPRITFTAHGLLGDAVDQLIPPAISYPLANIVPPKAVGAAMFSINGVTDLVLKRGRIAGQWEFARRADMNSASGVAGIARTRRAPIAEFAFETPAKAKLDPDALWRNATEFPFSIQCGSVKYNKHTWSGPKAQLSQPPGHETGDGNKAVSVLTCQLNPSALGQNDEIKVVCD